MNVLASDWFSRFRYRNSNNIEKKRNNVDGHLPRYDCKGAGHEHLIEAPLIHVVMSGCYGIAFGLFAILCFVRKVGWLVIGSGNQFSDRLNIGILVFVTVVFAFRRYHYRARQIELVDRYYKAYCNEDANQNQTEDQEEE